MSRVPCLRACGRRACGQPASARSPSATPSWRNIAAAFSVLDGKVPYIVAVGNHDYDLRADPEPNTADKVRHWNVFFGLAYFNFKYGNGRFLAVNNALKWE